MKSRWRRVGVGAACLCLASLSAQGALDLLVTDYAGGTVERYDGVTGAFKSNVVSGLTNPWGLALSRDRYIVYVVQYSNGRVYRYNSTTFQNLDAASFFTPSLVTYGLTVAANGDLLFGGNAGQVRRYGTDSAAKPGAGETGANFTDNKGGRPRYSAYGPSGRLFVTQTDVATGNYVYEFDPATGNIAATNAQISSGSAAPEGMGIVFGPSYNAGGSTDMYVCVEGGGVYEEVRVYEGVSGVQIGTIDLKPLDSLWHPYDLAFNPNATDELIVVSGNNKGSRRFKINGNGTHTDLGAFLSGAPAGAFCGVVFLGPALPRPALVGDLLVADCSGHQVKRYDGWTGVFKTNLAAYQAAPLGMALNPSSTILYVSDITSNRVYRYNTATGQRLDPGAFLPVACQGVTVGPSGDLHLGTTSAGRILRYDSSGAAKPGSGEAGANFSDALPPQPRHTAFGPDGHLYVTQTDRAAGNNIYKINGTNGNTISTWAQVSVGSALPEAMQATFGPSFNAGGTRDLYAAVEGLANEEEVRVYEGTTGAYIGALDLYVFSTTWRPRGVAFNVNRPDELIVVSGTGQGSRRFGIMGDGTYVDRGPFLSGGSPGARLETIVFLPIPPGGPRGSLFILR